MPSHAICLYFLEKLRDFGLITLVGLRPLVSPICTVRVVRLDVLESIQPGIPGTYETCMSNFFQVA